MKAHALQEIGYVMNERPYDDFANREINVNIYARKGRRPSKPYIRKIRDIISTNPIL